MVNFIAEKATTSASARSTKQTLVIPPRKRGRPKRKVEDTLPKLKLLDKLKAAASNNTASQPAVYASTTKGGVKLVYDGHLFKFSFRKAEFSVFQCCFREHGEECKVRVVCDQKNVFPFDGEHGHFMQASDKSITSSKFTPAESNVDTPSKPKSDTGKVEIVLHNTEANVEFDEDTEVFEILEIEKPGTSPSSPYKERSVTPVADEEEEEENRPATEEPVADIDPNDFREKIKKRLQKALQNKKK